MPELLERYGWKQGGTYRHVLQLLRSTLRAVADFRDALDTAVYAEVDDVVSATHATCSQEELRAASRFTSGLTSAASSSVVRAAVSGQASATSGGFAVAVSGKAVSAQPPGTVAREEGPGASDAKVEGCTAEAEARMRQAVSCAQVRLNDTMRCIIARHHEALQPSPILPAVSAYVGRLAVRLSEEAMADVTEATLAAAAMSMGPLMP